MNIRDYLFIRKAKSSNKIKILDLLGFEADTTIIQTPDIIKEMDNLRITNELEMVDEEIESVQIGQELVTTKENIFDSFEEENSTPDTQTFIPLNITTQLKKIWTDLEIRRQWVVPTLLVITTVSVISFVSVFFINIRNNNIQNENITVSITDNTNNNIGQIPQLLDVATNPFYSRYDVSNASANLQIIETSLLQYQENLENREISDREVVISSINSLFDIVNKLDELFTYRIMHSEILIYDEILLIDEDTNIDTLATELSLIGAKSNLNGETLPDLDEFREHKELVNSALNTAQDLHGRLVASLRNNEKEVAATLISAIELNKETEIAFFNSVLKTFNEDYSKLLENIGNLP
tara:strand:- start:6264 stop:7322 length:1059 start_codon:yes stop_codon:yes gene_type:complete